MLPAQSVVACLRFHAFCKMHRRRGCSLLRAKREPERTAVPAGHESPSGAFKPQTGLQSKCRVFSAARSQRFQRAGSMKKGLLAPFRPQSCWAPYKKSKPLKDFLCSADFESLARRAVRISLCIFCCANASAGSRRCKMPLPATILSREKRKPEIRRFPAFFR
jgi:hypothetical protein